MVARLLRIGNNEIMLLGQQIHPRAGRKIQSVLLAPVEHDHEWNGFTGVAGRNVEVVAAGSGAPGVREVADLTTRRGGSPRRRATTRRSCGSRRSGRSDDVWQAGQRALDALNRTRGCGRGIGARHCWPPRWATA